MFNKCFLLNRGVTKNVVSEFFLKYETMIPKLYRINFQRKPISVLQRLFFQEVSQILKNTIISPLFISSNSQGLLSSGRSNGLMTGKLQFQMATVTHKNFYKQNQFFSKYIYYLNQFSSDTQICQWEHVANFLSEKTPVSFKTSKQLRNK